MVCWSVKDVQSFCCFIDNPEPSFINFEIDEPSKGKIYFSFKDCRQFNFFSLFIALFIRIIKIFVWYVIFFFKSYSTSLNTSLYNMHNYNKYKMGVV